MNHSGNVLAFIGDAVMSVQVREYLIEKGMSRTKDLQETSTKFVSAKSQAGFVDYLIENKIMTEEEFDIYKRGRNAKSASTAKNAEVKDYRKATGLEALWGFLYFKKDYDRLDHLWELFKSEVKL